MPLLADKIARRLGLVRRKRFLALNAACVKAWEENATLSEALARHERWCGHNREAHGDDIVNDPLVRRAVGSGPMSLSGDLDGLPDDLARALRDQSIVVRQDAAVFELIAKWQNAPSNTASADLPKGGGAD